MADPAVLVLMSVLQETTLTSSSSRGFSMRYLNFETSVFSCGFRDCSHFA